MLGRNLSAAKQEFEQIRRLLAISHRDRSFVVPYGLEDCWPDVDDVDHTYWRAFEHCATITRAYATFERFVIASVEQWIEWCLRHNPDLILKSESARDAYEKGFAEILRRKSEARFADLDRGKLAVGLSVFHSGIVPENYTLPPAPFFATLPNMRLPTVVALFNSIGLASFSNWIRASRRLSDFCLEENYKLEEEIAQLVERRNEAAHGNGIPAEILGTNELTARITLLSLLCESIFQFVLTAICKAELGDAFERGTVGTVTRVWPRVNAFELRMDATVIYTGTEVLVSAEGCTQRSAIRSLQLEGKPSIGLNVAIGTYVGVVMSYVPTEGMRMISISGIRGIEALMSEGYV